MFVVNITMVWCKWNFYIQFVKFMEHLGRVQT